MNEIALKSINHEKSGKGENSMDICSSLWNYFMKGNFHKKN